MGTLGEWFKKYNNYTPGNQNNGNNAVKQNPSINQSGNTTLAAWFEKYNNYTPSGADTVQPPTGTEAVVPSTQPNGYKSQNAAHLSSGLSRDDFDSSVRNRNQLRALEESRAQDTRDKVATHMVMTGSRVLPALSEIEKISPFTKGETLSFENGNGEQKDFTIPYFDYESNKPNTVIQAEGYLKSTGETLKKLQSDIENNSAQLQYYESSVNKYVDELERLAAHVQSNPTAAGYAAYNNLYDKYQKAYSEYEAFISEHNAKIGLYNDYTQRYETAAADVRKYNEQWDAANLDFFEKSKIGLQNFYDIKETEKQAHREAENEKPWWQKMLDANAKSYTITNENPAVYAANAVVENYKNDTSYKEPSDEWTDGQKNIFGYLWAVDKDKAHEFAITVNESIAEEREGKTSKKIKDWVTKNLGTGILGTAGALILSPTAVADVTDNLAEYAARGRITKKGTLSPFDISQTITGGITEELNETYGTIDKRVPVVGGKGLGDLYKLGYSMAQSMTAGKISKLAGNRGFTYATFFGQGAASGIDKQLDADGTAGQAISYGLVAGAAEALLEAMGMESLFKEGNGKLLKEMLKQGGVEALEEGLTSVVDFVADTLIMMDKSAVFKATEEYSKIMSEDKAKLTALMDVLEGIAYDALGGIITGGADTAILAGANKVGQVIDVEKEKSRQEQTIKNADAVIKAYGEAVQQYGENSPQAMELNSKSERAYIEKVRANLRLGMLNGKSTTVTTQERSEEEITQLVTQAQSAGDATAETGYYAGASDQLIKFAQQEKAILKQLTGRNVDIRFYQADAGENGHYDPKTGTIYVNVNSAQPFSYIEGHEFTHELENSAGYAEYAEWVKTEGLGAMYNTYKENIKRRYESRGINLTELELEQEVVATWTGENLFTDDTTMKKLIKKLSDGKPTLARKIFGGIRRFVSRSRSGITRNHYERALYLYQQMAQGKASAVSSAQTVNENAPTSFPAETAKVPQKQKNTAEAVNTAENDIMISNGEAVAQDNGKIANDSEFTPAVRELVDRIADTARQIEASDQKGADYRRLKKEQKANLRALEQLRGEGKIDSVEYNRAIEALRDTTEGPEYGGIEESKANLQAQFEAGEIALEDYESAMAELEEVGAEENNGVKYSLADIDGNPIDEARISRNKVDIKYSLNHNPEIAQGQQDYLKSHNAAISMKELTEAQRITNAMVDVMMKYSSILPEDKIGKVLTKNGSYDRSVENTTICIRTLAYNEFVDKVQEEVGRPLTQMESFLVSQKLYDIATDPQCLYCYVSLDRKAFNDMLLRYMQDRDSVIAKYNNSDKSDEAVKQLYEDFLNGRKDTKNMKERFNKWLSYVDNGTQLLSLADIATEDRQSVIKADGGILAEQLKDARAYAQSASWSKIQKAYVAYRDEILKLGDKVVKSLNEHYGLRWYSFSDYSPAFIVENMQQITDASIRGLKGLSYTKDTDYAEIFAPSGMNINVSVFVNQDANGNFFIDEKQSANFEKALELRERYPNVGIVATVTNDEALRWAGEQEWSDVIIPFHIVRTGTDVAEYYKWLNYTAESADSVKDADMWNAYLDSLNLSSENARKKVSKNIYPNEHKNDKATYLNLCESRGLSPRFARFAGEDWYMKLVNETRLSADETPSLKPIYNEDAAKESFRKFVEKGGYEGGWYRENVDVDAEIKEVAQDVLAGKKANEVSYGRQDGYSPENLISGRKTNRNHGYRFSLEAPTREEVIGELRQYMSGARSKDQIRDVIARVKKNPQSEIYGGPARRPQYPEGVQKILADAEREGMSVRDYISQNIDEFEVRGKLIEDARKALEISGDYRKFSVEDVRANRPPRSIEELDRILAEAEPLDPNEFRKTDFDRWYERREKEDQLHEKMGELVMKAPDENEINTTLEELASDLGNGYITPDAALEIVEGLKSTAKGERVRYSLEEYTVHQKENWANSKRIVIYENDAQFTQFIENSVSDKTFDKKMYFGAISPELARRIQNDTAINVEHYNLSLSSNEIRKILKKHGNAESEALSGQRAVTTDDFLHILDVVLNPDNIKLSDQTYAGKPVIIFTGTYNGQMNIVAVVSDKRLDLFVQTVYVNTKRGTLATPIGETILYHTPEANSGTDSSARIVPQNPEVVKPAVKKSVEDIEIQPIEESSNGTAMQNYNRLYESGEFEDDKTAKSYQRFFPAEAVEYLRGKYRITNEQEAAEAYQSSIRLKDQVRRTELRLKISEQDKALALEILCGDKSISDIQNASDKEGLLEYIAVLGEAEVMAEAWKNWKTEKRSEWQKEADGMYKTFDSSVKGGFKYDKKGNIKTDKRGNPKFQDDATNKAGYKYVRETQTRITYDIFADDKFAEAKAFNDWLFEPERASEARSNRYKNKMRDQVRELKLGTKIQKGNAVSESAAVQILGELQDIIRRTKRQADMGNADTYRVNGLTYNEAVWSLAELKKQNPNMDFSENGKIQKAVEKFGQLYAEMLSDMNQTLVRNGYPPVPARSGYFPHFADEGDTLIRRIGRALGIDTDVSVLPTGINGLTHTFKPGKTWFANALERKGHKTAYDAVLGFDKYIEGAANVIFHTDNIQRQRYFARAIRYNASDEAIKAKIDEITANDTLNEDEKDLQIQYVTSRTKFRHSTYVVQLEDHTNSLAGKKTFSDRDMERLMGRKAYTWMKNIEGRVAANMIAGNLSSALSNFIPLQYCKAEIGEWQTLRAMAETLRSFARDDGFVDRSDFLTNRYGSEFLVKSGIDKVSEKLSIPMEAIDHFTAQVLVRAAYNKYLKKGASPELAMERANSFAAGVMADRSRGALPEIFNNKNPLYKSFTMFQVEVNNNLSHIFKDIPRHYRDENKAKWIGAVAWILAKLFFGIWIFNETSEKIVGRRMAGTDVVDAANEVAGDLSGYRLPNTWDLIEAIFKGEDISAMFEANKVGAGQAILNLGETAAEDVPFVSSLFGGGDLPVGSALPDLSTILPLIGSEKDGENIKQTLIEEGLKPVSYALLPFGANQASKIHKGISALAKGGSYKTNSKGEEILQYPIYSDNILETAWDHLRVFAFGKSATDQSREWVDSGFKSLSARGTAAYKGMIAAGVDEGDAHSLIIDIMSVEPTDQEIEEKIVSMGGVDRVFSETVSNGPTSTDLKCEIIRNADISDEGKAILYFAMIANESECNFMSSMQEAGADMGAVVAELLDKKTGSDAHKYSAIMSSGLHEAEQLWQIYLLDTSAEKSTHKRYYVASDTFGISPNEYRVANDFLTNYLDGNSKTNERVAAAVREYAETVPLTKTEKAVLWQLLSKSTSAKNNPFDVRTGERVLTAINNYDREEEEFYAKYGPQPQ